MMSSSSIQSRVPPRVVSGSAPPEARAFAHAMRTTSRVSLFFLPLLYQSYRESAKRAISAACTSRPVHVADAALACAELSAPCVRATVSCWREHVCAPRNPLCVCAPRNPLCIIQAALAVNFLGPCAAACKRSNSFLNARCTTYTTTPHLLSLKAQKCDPTCTSPAAGRSGTHSGPVAMRAGSRRVRWSNGRPTAAPSDRPSEAIRPLLRRVSIEMILTA